MMTQKMISFLSNELGIEHIEEFDFKFGAISKNPSTNVFNMQIIKETPWTYDLLDYFVGPWPTEKYELNFAYNNEILGKDILALFKEMFLSKFYRNTNAKFEIQDNIILYSSKEDEQKISKLVLDFESLLKQINYPRFRIISNTNENIEVLLVFLA